MAYSAHGHDAHHDHNHKPGFFVRWFLSTNHKDIGTLYLIFSVMTGLIGGAASVLMRMELHSPGVQFMTDAAGGADGQLWNVLVTAHGLLQDFFVVMPALLGGVGNWVVPLMVGALDQSFPRLPHIRFYVLVPLFFVFFA